MNDPNCEWAALMTSQCSCQKCETYRAGRWMVDHLKAQNGKKQKEQSNG